MAASPATAQPRVPATTTRHALPGVVPAGTTVVVRTRDGQSTKGRVSSLSNTAIVLEGGRVRSFPAMGAGIGAGIGLMVPGRRAVLYRQPVGPAGVSLAPIVGRDQRGVAVRVVF